MIIILIGVLILLVGFIVDRTDPQLRKYRNVIRVAGIIAIVIGITSASVVQVEPGQVGVQKLFGKVSDRILESGLNVINPLVKVVMFDVRTENYTMSAVRDEGVKQGDDAIRVLSADGLEVIVDLTVLYRVIPAEAPRILKEVGTDYRMCWWTHLPQDQIMRIL
jgi:regulator of protease activity HflC (stomatin/prohibitin superfamily)